MPRSETGDVSLHNNVSQLVNPQSNYWHMQSPLPRLSLPSTTVYLNSDFSQVIAQNAGGMYYFPQCLVTTDSLDLKSIQPEKPQLVDKVVAEKEKATDGKPVGEKSVVNYSAFAKSIFSARENTSLSRSQKLQQAQAEGLQFIQKHLGDKDALLQAVEALGVTVIRGEEQPWVDQWLKTMNNRNVSVLAAVYTPDTINFPEQAEKMVKAKRYTKAMADIPEFVAFNNKVEREGRVALLAGSGQSDDLGVLYHEIFHLFQLKNGLNTYPVVYDVEKFNELYNTATQKGLMYRFYFATVVRPLIWGLQTIGLLKEVSGGVGQASRAAANTELEAIGFLQKNAKALKLSRNVRRWNRQYSKINEYLKLYSWQADAKDRFGALWIF